MPELVTESVGGELYCYYPLGAHVVRAVGVCGGRPTFKYTRIEITVVPENSNMAKLASNRYLVVHSLPQEDRYDTDDASTRELYTILVSESTVCTVQLPRCRQHCASLVDGPA